MTLTSSQFKNVWYFTMVSPIDALLSHFLWWITKWNEDGSLSCGLGFHSDCIGTAGDWKISWNSFLFIQLEKIRQFSVWFLGKNEIPYSKQAKNSWYSWRNLLNGVTRKKAWLISELPSFWGCFSIKDYVAHIVLRD